jgi:hypothetical protein
MAKEDKKESPAEKRLKKEKELDKLNSLGLRDKRDSFIFKDKDTYGTSLSKGAEYAGKQAYKKAYKKVEEEEPLVFEKKPDNKVKVRLKTEGEKGAAGLAASRKAEREAASEERREMRGVEKDSKKKLYGGGMTTKKMMGGGMSSNKYSIGGMVKSNCGASVKPSGGSRNK